MKLFKTQPKITSNQDIQNQLIELKSLSKATILTLMGISGKINGLNVIFIADESINSKQFAGKLSAFYHQTLILTEPYIKKQLNMITVPSNNLILFCTPINTEMIFAGMVNSQKNLDRIQNWLNRNKNAISQVLNKDLSSSERPS